MAQKQRNFYYWMHAGHLDKGLPKAHWDTSTYDQILGGHVLQLDILTLSRTKTRHSASVTETENPT